MRKNYRKISSWIADVDKQLANPTSDKNNDLYSLGWRFTCVCRQLNGDVLLVHDVINLLRRIRVASGPGRCVFEERVMECINWVVNDAIDSIKHAGMERQNTLSVPELNVPELQTAWEIVHAFSLYAIDCLEFSRPRDSLAGMRRRYAFELLGSASYVFDMPEAVFAFVDRTLKKGRRPAVVGALLFCESFYKARKASLPSALEEQLLRLVERTDSRGLAVGALNTLVEAGNISEFEALDHIDDWKDRH